MEVMTVLMKPLMIMPWRKEATQRKKRSQRGVLKVWMHRGVSAPHPHRFSVTVGTNFTPMGGSLSSIPRLPVLWNTVCASLDGLPGPESWDSTGLGVPGPGPSGLSCRTRSSCLELKDVSLFNRWGMAPKRGCCDKLCEGQENKTFPQETLILCVVLESDSMAVFVQGSLYRVS